MRRIGGCALFIAAFTVAASAQDFRGAIGGRVGDSLGAVLPGVTVTATNTATNQPTSSRVVYNNPNTDPLNAEFGKVTSQANLPRDIHQDRLLLALDAA